MIALACLASAQILNIDAGSQFVRIAATDNMNNVVIMPNKNRKTSTPNSVSFRLSSYPDKHVELSDIQNLQIKYGEESLRWLKNHPKSGLSSLTALIGRELEEFEVYNPLAEPEEFLSILLKELTSSSDYTTIERCYVTVPAYFTSVMRQGMVKALYSAELPFAGCVDDVQALSQLYSHRFKARFEKENHSVLFIDIGSNHASAFRVAFFRNSTGIFANHTSYEFTEESGSMAFARAIAESRSIPLRKAQKMLITSSEDFSEELATELEELSRIIRLALADDEVDEIQLIGGASKLSCVRTAVESAAGMKVSTEFPTFDSNAIGGGLVGLSMSDEGATIEERVTMIRCSPYTTYLECEGQRAEHCRRSQNCTDFAIIDGAIGDRVTIRAAEDELPRGVKSDVITEWDLTNISSFDRDDEEIFSGIFLLTKGLPIIEHVQWCITSTLNCTAISHAQVETNLTKFESSKQLVIEARYRDSLRRRLLNARQEGFVILEEVQNAMKDPSMKIEGASEDIARLENIINNSQDLKEVQNAINELKEKLRALTYM